MTKWTWRAASVLAAALLVGTPVSATATPSAGEDDAFIIGGVEVNQVMFDGELMRLDQYHQDSEGSSWILIVDDAAVERGYLVAYSDRDSAAAYMRDHGLGELSSSEREPEREAATAASLAERMDSAADPGASVARGCSMPNHVGYFYEDISCGGASLGITWNDAVPDLGFYGWNDRISSAALGDCIGTVTMWPDSNYRGSPKVFGSSRLNPTMPSGYNDRISSYKSTASGVC